MTFSRRTLLTGAATLAAGATVVAQDAPHAGHEHPQPPPEPSRVPAPPAPRNGASPSRGPGRVHTLNGRSLEWRMVNGVKEFHLTAEEVEHEFAPGCKARCWGYNGSTPGPTIEAVEGDRVRILVTNRLPEPTELAKLEAVAAAAFGVDDPSRVVATGGTE